MTKKSEPREHDFTYGYWGHNLNIRAWNKEKRTGRAVCWVTPALQDGDIVIVNSVNGTMRLLATEVEWVNNVDDMYRFTITPADPEPPASAEEEELWVTKVRRETGGSSILNVTTKEKAEALAAEFNAQFQTDAYYIQKYDEKLHAYSRHG